MWYSEDALWFTLKIQKRRWNERGCRLCRRSWRAGFINAERGREKGDGAGWTGGREGGVRNGPKMNGDLMKIRDGHYRMTGEIFWLWRRWIKTDLTQTDEDELHEWIDGDAKMGAAGWPARRG